MRAALYLCSAATQLPPGNPEKKYIYMANIEPSRCVPNSLFLALPLRLYEHVGGSGGGWRWSGGCCLRALRERLDAVVRRRSETDDNDDSYQIGIHSTSLLLCTQHTFNSKEHTETDIVLIVLVTRRRSKYNFGATTTRYAMPCHALPFNAEYERNCTEPKLITLTATTRECNAEFNNNNNNMIWRSEKKIVHSREIQKNRNHSRMCAICTMAGLVVVVCRGSAQPFWEEQAIGYYSPGRYAYGWRERRKHSGIKKKGYCVWAKRVRMVST